MSRTNCAIGKDIVRASFKGVGFDCKEVDYEGGRRGAEGEFPFGERTAYADLGRKIRVFHLTAVLREDSHVGDGRALFKACESPGPGPLVHPTYGTIVVACRSAKVKDDLESVGETTVDLEFVEANTGGLGALGGSLFGIVASGLNGASQTSFIRDYTPMLVSQPWRADVINQAQALVQTVLTTSKHTMVDDATPDLWRDVLRIEEVAQDDSLASSAVNVDRALTAGFNITADNIQDPDARFTVMRKLANKASVSSNLPQESVSPSPPQSSVSSNLPLGVATDSEEAVLSRHRVLAGIGMAEAAMSKHYDYVDQVLMAMDAVMVVLEDEAQAAYQDCDNPLFLELRKYETEFSQMMNDLAYRLPGLIIVDFNGGIHPLVAAYAIYDDSKRHRELEQRNKVDVNGRFAPVVIGVAPSATV